MYVDGHKTIGCIVMVVFVVLVVALFLLLEMKGQRLYNRASSLHASGQDEEALVLLLKAE